MQFAFQFGDLAVAQLGRPVEVIVAFGFLGLVPELLELPAQFLYPPDRLPFGIPLGVPGVGL